TGSAALGWATAAAGVIIAVIAPAWGQRSDATGGAGSRQRRLGALTAVVVLVTGAGPGPPAPVLSAAWSGLACRRPGC
ncbi:MAG: hypothetical protein ACRDRB_17560, partial [Pseudonocardiaceae bacterium]